MPYIKLADRPMFDTMIDGLVSKIRGFDLAFMGKIVGGLAINAMTPASHPAPCQLEIESGIDRIVRDLARRIRVRGDANYCICRILLEAMKPETGWGYHSLSDTVMACDAAINLVYDVQRDQKLEDAEVADAISVLGDVVTEIERRLIGPYEDTAILKNGDLACFASEDFALKPLGLGLQPSCGPKLPCRKYGPKSNCDPILVPDLNMSDLDNTPCGCGCGCEQEDKPEHKPIFDAFDLSVMKGALGPVPLIAEALTQAQHDAIDRERQGHERAE